MKRLLIVTYYWPPSGGPGVQRVLKFVKYLPQYGWQPIVLTVRDGEYPVLDPTLENEIPRECTVYRSRSWEPTRLYKKFTGRSVSKPLPVAVVAAEKKSWKESLAAWLRMAFFIPDAKIGWKPFAVRLGMEIIEKHRPDAILSSSPPPTVHLIARSLARRAQLPWIADFRDPWTRIYHYDTVKKPWIRRWLDTRLEEKVVRDCSVPVTVSRGFTRIIGSPEQAERFRIIPNGFDFDLAIGNNSAASGEKFIILHSGKLVDSQNPDVFWETLAGMCAQNTKFRERLELRFIGTISNGILDNIRRAGLEGNLSCPGYVPHYRIPPMLRQASLLMLVIPATSHNHGIVPGKLFEYLASGRPILAFGPQAGDVGNILHRTRGGRIFEFGTQSAAALKTYLLDMFNRGEFLPDPEEIEKYHRKRLTQELVHIAEEISRS